ncbi:putative GPN-loop GTPase 3-like protein, partial [Naja naja]
EKEEEKSSAFDEFFQDG